MSRAAVNFVWDASTAATPAEIVVLLALADWADVYGYCYPSYGAIAEKARVSVRQAQRVVGKFVAAGELERVRKGHTQNAPGHRPGRTGLQARNSYRFTAIPDEAESSDTLSPLRTAKAATPRRGSSDTSDVEVVTNDASHIRKNHQIDPEGTEPERAAASPLALSVQANDPPDPPEAAPALPDVLETFRDAWNEAAMTAEPPLPRCDTLTRKRRRLIRACLVERPITVWREIFARVARSTFLTANTRGWPASLDWLIASPEPALKVLEGQFDDRAPQRPRPGQTPAYSEWRCPHVTPCANRSACANATLLGRPETVEAIA